MRILTGRAAQAKIASLADRRSRFAEVEPAVSRIVNEVRKKGDSALRRYAERWDGLAAGDPLRIPAVEIEAAWAMAPAPLRASLRRAARNIRRYCEWQRPREWRRNSGEISLGQLVRPLESVGCYVPGGRYPLLSTLLMTVIPAQVAGIEQIRVVSPSPGLEVLAAAALLGVREVARMRSQR
jgi:histidinol dehydrogenase